MKTSWNLVRRVLALTLSLILAFALTACKDSKGAENEGNNAGDKTQSVTAEVETTTKKTETTTEKIANDEDAQKQAAALAETLEDALDECKEWGPGISGASLRSMSNAVGLVSWAVNNGAADLSEDILRTAVGLCVADLDAEDLQTIETNWPAISADADRLFTDYDSAKLVCEDAGVREAADKALADKNAKDDWNALKTALSMEI